MSQNLILGKKMLKLFKTVFFAIALVSLANANSQISDKEIKEIEALKLFKDAGVKIQKGVLAEGMYLLNVNVRGKADKIYLTQDKKYLIAGDVIDTNTRMALTIPDLPVDLTPTLGKEAFTFGKGKDEYVLFTDPECPYCKKFESYFSQIEDKVKIRVFFFPLDFHKNAKDISMYIMSQKSYEDKVKAMTTTTKDSEGFKNRKYKDGELEKLKANLDEQIKIGTSLGVRGTPSVYDKNGNKVSWAAMLQGFGIVVK